MDAYPRLMSALRIKESWVLSRNSWHQLFPNVKRIYVFVIQRYLCISVAQVWKPDISLYLETDASEISKVCLFNFSVCLSVCVFGIKYLPRWRNFAILKHVCQRQCGLCFVFWIMNNNFRCSCTLAKELHKAQSFLRSLLSKDKKISSFTEDEASFLDL